MAVESPPAFLQASEYGAEQQRRAIYAMLQRGASIGSVSGGLIGSTDMELTAGTGLHVLVAPGEAIIPGSTSATQSGYYGRVSSSTELVIAAANETNPRVDRVSAIVKDAAYSGAENTFTVAVETGTPTSGATLINLSGVAAAPASSITLGYVLVNAKAVAVSGVSNVATRVGLVAGSVGDSQIASARTLLATTSKYETKTFTKAEWEAGITLSASRLAIIGAINIAVFVTPYLVIGGVTFEASAPAYCAAGGAGLVVLPGQTIKHKPTAASVGVTYVVL